MSQEPPIWRLSFGSFRHIGLTRTGRVLRQHGRVSGDGRLTPIWYALVVNTVTGRLALDFSLRAPDEEFLCAFWRAVVESGHVALGPMTKRVVVARGGTTGMVGLVDAISSSGAQVYHGRMAFKDGVHAGRAFEHVLAAWFLRHSLFGLIKNWGPLWPKVVQAYNESVLLSEDENWRVIALADRVTAELGACPKEAARKIHEEGRLCVTDSRFERGPVLHRDYVNDLGSVWTSSGHYWLFNFSGEQKQVPLYVRRSRAPAAALHLDDVLVPSSSVPAQFRNSHYPTRPDPSGAVSLSTAAEELAKRAWGVVDHLKWIDGLASSLRQAAAPQAATAVPQRPCSGDVMLSPELVALGFSTVAGSWSVAKGEHFTFTLPVFWLEPTLGPNPGFAYECKPAGVLYIRWSQGKEPSTEFSPEYAFHNHREKELSATVGAAIKVHPRPILREGVLANLAKQHPRLLAEWIEQKREADELAVRKQVRAEATEAARAAARNRRPPSPGYDQWVSRAYRKELAQAYLPLLAPRGRCDIALGHGFVFRSPYDPLPLRILAVLVSDDRAEVDVRLEGVNHRGLPRTINADALDPETLHAVLSSAARQIGAEASRGNLASGA